MIISNAMPGGTQTNQYATNDPNKAKAATDFMNQWTAANPTGYDSDRAFMDADGRNGTQNYAAYQQKRTAAYDAWLAGQPPDTKTGGAMATGIIAAQQPTPTGAAPTTPMNAEQLKAVQNQQVDQTPAGAQTMQTMAAPAQTPSPPGTPQTNPGTPGGIISSAVGSNVNADGQITSTQGYNPAQLSDPKQWEVTQDQTMQGQLQGILGRNSALMDQARSRALDQANDMGMANSSMAITAGESALYDKALPIASNDANTMAKAAGYNTDIFNQFAMANVGFANKALEFGANASNAAGVANAGNQTNVNINRERNDTTRWTSQLDANTKLQLGQMDTDTRRYISDQDVGVRRELGQLDSSTKLQLGQLDANVRREGFATQKELGYLDANTKTNIAQMSNATQVQVTNIEAQYRKEIQGSQSAQGVYSNMAAQIAAIEQSALDPASKQRAIEEQQRVTVDALNLINNVNGVLGAIPPYTPAPPPVSSGPPGVPSWPPPTYPAPAVGGSGIDYSGTIDNSRNG